MTSKKKDLYNLADGWLELESDPGLFTLLLEDMGVEGTQVEEIYDLQREPLVEGGQCYGAIFLFRWIDDRRSRRKIVDEQELYVKDEAVMNSIFFAQQVIPNSCATHALVSILLNCPTLNLGVTLSELQTHTQGMSPENKGLAIGNCPQLAFAHNSHAAPRARRRTERSGAREAGLTGSRFTSQETFHFVSYVPINGRLFELDGLRKFPLDHGPVGEDWTQKLRQVITERLGIATGGEPYHDIRFALMALVPDATTCLQRKLEMLKTNREIVIKALRQLLKLYHQRKVERTLSQMAPIREEMDSQSDIEDPTGSNSEAANEVKKLADEVIFALKDDSGLEKEVSSIGNNVDVIVDKLENHLKVEETAPSVEPKVVAAFVTREPSPKINCDQRPTKSLVNKVISRCSSIDSQYSGPPRSPFQSNPLLTAHDYAKSPLMEGLEESGDSLDFAPRVEDSNDTNGESVSDNLESVDSQGQSDTTNERVESGLDRSSSATPMITAETDTANVKPESAAKVTSDIDDDGAMSVDEEYVQKPDNTDAPLPHFDAQNVQLQEPYSFSPKDLVSILRSIETDIFCTENKVRDEVEKKKKFRTDDNRRVHNYDEFITSFLAMLLEQNMLAELVQQSLGKAEKSTKKEPEKESKLKVTDKTKKQGAIKGNLKQVKYKPKKKRLISDSDLSDTWDSASETVTVTPNIMYKDPRLPAGWQRKVRKQNLTGKYDVWIVNPTGRKFKTRSELKTFLDRQSDSEVDIDSFDFSLSGSTKRSNIKLKTKKKK